jgi:hypothetical protein
MQELRRRLIGLRRPAERSPLLLLGEGAIPVAHDLLSHLLVKGERVLVADGGNNFDAYHLARAARQLRQPVPTLLSAVRVSRAFTWQQHLALLQREIAPEAARSGARWVLALSPLDLFADHEVKPFQAYRGARQAAEALAELARAGLGIIAAQSPRALAGGNRLELLDYLKRHCGHHVGVERQESLPPEPVAAIPAPEDRQLALPFASWA